MSKPAARLTDMHTCPMMIPGLPPIPHVGGPIIGPGSPMVLIGNMPAAVMGDMCVCVGPPDSIILGSMGVLIGNKPAARMGDTTAHGGAIVLGFPTVLIGESSGGGGGGASPITPVNVMLDMASDMPAGAGTEVAQTAAMNEAAVSGSAGVPVM